MSGAYQTPADVLLSHAQVRAAGWTANDIGQLLRLGLVRGVKLKRGSLVLPADVVRLATTRLRA